MSENKFVYEVKPGVEISLPLMQDMPIGVLRRTRKLDTLDAMFTQFEVLLTEDELSYLDDLTMGDAELLLAAWTEASTVSPGESTAS